MMSIFVAVDSFGYSVITIRESYRIVSNFSRHAWFVNNSL